MFFGLLSSAARSQAPRGADGRFYAVLDHAAQVITDWHTTQAIEAEMARIIRPVMVAIG